MLSDRYRHFSRWDFKEVIHLFTRNSSRPCDYISQKAYCWSLKKSSLDRNKLRVRDGVDKQWRKLRAGHFFLFRRAKRARHVNDHGVTEEALASRVRWRRESKRKGLNATFSEQFAALPLVKLVVWFVSAVVNWSSPSVAKSTYYYDINYEHSIFSLFRRAKREKHANEQACNRTLVSRFARWTRVHCPH